MEGSTRQADISLRDIPQHDNNQECVLEEQYDSEATLSSDEAHEALKTLEALETLQKTCEGDIAESVEDLGYWEKYIERVTVKVEDNERHVGSKLVDEVNLQPLQQVNIKEDKQKQIKTKIWSTRKSQYQMPGPYTCSYTGCDKAYNYKWDSENHIKTAHLGHENKCAGCGKNFSKRANLLGHMRKKICPIALSPLKSEERKLPRNLEDIEGDQKEIKHNDEANPFLTVFF